MLRDRLRGLRGALDRAGVDDGDGQPGQAFAECLRLLATGVGEVDTRGPARQQWPGLRGHRMTGEHQAGGLRVLGFGLGIGLRLIGHSPEFYRRAP